MQAFEGAVHKGDIYWHALPFNGQLEFFDVSLLEFAVQLTHELDVKFGLPPKRTMSQVRTWQRCVGHEHSSVSCVADTCKHWLLLCCSCASSSLLDHVHSVALQHGVLLNAGKFFQQA